MTGMSMKAWRRQGRIDIAKILMLGAFAAGAYAIWAFIPPYWTSKKMEEVVTVSILEWRDRNQMRAESQLAHELDKREIPMYIMPEDCEFWEEGREKHVSCYWAVDVKYPLIDKRTTLEYEVHQYLDADQDLHTW